MYSVNARPVQASQKKGSLRPGREVARANRHLLTLPPVNFLQTRFNVPFLSTPAVAFFPSADRCNTGAAAASDTSTVSSTDDAPLFFTARRSRSLSPIISTITSFTLNSTPSPSPSFPQRRAPSSSTRPGVRGPSASTDSPESLDARLRLRLGVSGTSESETTLPALEAIDDEDALASRRNGGDGGIGVRAASAAAVRNDAARLRRLVALFRLRSVAVSASLVLLVLLPDGTRMVERRRTSLAVNGSTTPLAFKLRRENRGAAAADIQFTSGSRDVLGAGASAVEGMDSCEP